MESNKLQEKMNVVLIRGDNIPTQVDIFGKQGGMVSLNNENLFVLKDDIYSVKTNDESMSLSMIELEERNKYIKKLEKENILRKRLREHNIKESS